MTINNFSKKMSDALVVVPNWNGADFLENSLKSIVNQTKSCDLFVVDNGSVDQSLDIIKKYTGNYRLHDKNLGFSGGVNPGMQLAIDKGYKYVFLFNNDAVAEKDVLHRLTSVLDKNEEVGISTSKILSSNKERIDSTGDFMTSWGLPFPRGRDTQDKGQFDNKTSVFAASGGASCYRVAMLKEVGLMDDDFFAYYEDVDLSYRAQLAGWKVLYAPKAIVVHSTGSTSGRMKSFTTRMAIKNLPWLVIKNTPTKYILHVLIRFTLVYSLFIGRAILRGQFKAVLFGFGKMLLLLPKKIHQRYKIQRSREVSSDYIWFILVHDLPDNATKLRSIRSKIMFWKKY